MKSAQILATKRENLKPFAVRSFNFNTNLNALECASESATQSVVHEYLSLIRAAGSNAMCVWVSYREKRCLRTKVCYAFSMPRQRLRKTYGKRARLLTATAFLIFQERERGGERERGASETVSRTGYKVDLNYSKNAIVICKMCSELRRYARQGKARRGEAPWRQATTTRATLAAIHGEK